MRNYKILNSLPNVVLLTLYLYAILLQSVFYNSLEFDDDVDDNHDPRTTYHPSSEGVIILTPHNRTKIRIPPWIMPAEENHTATMIFLHDYEDGTYFCRYEMHKIILPYMKVVCPHGMGTNITYFAGHAVPTWFDFSERVYPQEGMNTTHIETSNKYIHKLIDEEIKRGIPPERIIVYGNMQGGVMALYSALSYPKRLAGIITMAPFKPVKELMQKIYNPVNKDIPIFQIHLTTDAYSPNNTGKEISTYLKDHFSKNFQYREYKDERYDEVKEFCQKLLDNKSKKSR